MKAPRQSIDYLNDIIDAIGKAEAFSSDMSMDEFLADDKTLYFGVDATVIWKTVKEDIPPIKNALYRVIQETHD